MDAILTIESDEAVRLAEQLAALTGQSVREAVTRALADSLRRQREATDRAAAILAVAAEIRSHLAAPLPSSDHGWLYGEDGLPA